MSSAGPTNTNSSKAFSFTPSGNWDGNDGAWSTFVIRVGTPSQFFRVLPSSNGQEILLPLSDQCGNGKAWCGNARGVMPLNGAFESPYSGSPSPARSSTLDAGWTCTANKSPTCITCANINGKCTSGPCIGRYCCSDYLPNCNSQGCNGLSGICTGAYIGCPCSGIDYNAPPGTLTGGAFSAFVASGYQSNETSTWQEKPGLEIQDESYLNVTSSAQYGVDVVGLGPEASAGLSLSSSLIAIVPTEPFYLGSLGLKPARTTVVNQSKAYVSTATLMTQLKDQNLIPSLSYGYTAGAIYKNPPVLGSLTFGGYDASRFMPNDVSFPLTGFNSTDPMIGIMSITATGTLDNNITLLSNNIAALVDTTLPFLWLPLSACQAFEQAFGLVWDDSSQLYLVNDTIHQRLLDQTPTVTFELGNSTMGKASVNITLPYQAFDLQASSPIFPNGTNYFPLRRASSPSQYTLGRAFFQEAFLLVDYEKSNFSISQGLFPVNSPSDIITINYSTQSRPGNTTSSSQTSHHISRPIVIGIVAAFSITIALLCVLAITLVRRLRNRSWSNSRNTSTSHSPPIRITNTSPNSPRNSKVPTQHTLQAIISPDSEGLDRNYQDVFELGAAQRFVEGKPQPIIPHWATRRQELVGDNASKELPQTPTSLPPNPFQRVRHIYELAADEPWIAQHKH